MITTKIWQSNVLFRFIFLLFLAVLVPITKSQVKKRDAPPNRSIMYGLPAYSWPDNYTVIAWQDESKTSLVAAMNLSASVPTINFDNLPTMLSVSCDLPGAKVTVKFSNLTIPSAWPRQEMLLVIGGRHGCGDGYSMNFTAKATKSWVIDSSTNTVVYSTHDPVAAGITTSYRMLTTRLDTSEPDVQKRTFGKRKWTDKVKHALKKAGHDIEHGVDKLGHEIKDGVDKLGHEIKDGVDKLGHEIKDGVDKLGHEIKDGVDKLGHDIEHGVEKLGHDIKHEFNKLGDEIRKEVIDPMVKSLTKFEKKVQHDVENFLKNGIPFDISFGFPANFDLCMVQDFPLKLTNKASLSINCNPCSFLQRGHVHIEVTGDIFMIHKPTFQLRLDGHLKVSGKISISGALGIHEKKELQILEIPMTPLTIPGILDIGPHFEFHIIPEFVSEIRGGITIDYSVDILEYHLVLDSEHKNQATAPAIVRKSMFAAAGAFEVGLNLHVVPALGFGLYIFGKSFDLVRLQLDTVLAANVFAQEKESLKFTGDVQTFCVNIGTWTDIGLKVPVIGNIDPIVRTPTFEIFQDCYQFDKNGKHHNWNTNSSVELMNHFKMNLCN